jgi:flotillin
LAEVEVLRQKGLAEAEVIRQQGLAEAEATLKKAESWKEYTQAAIIQQLLDSLPEIAAAIAQPLAKTDRIVIVSNGSEGGAGASKVTQDVTNIIAQVPATVEALTGMDLMSAIGQLPGLKMQPEAGKDEEDMS